MSRTLSSSFALLSSLTVLALAVGACGGKSDDASSDEGGDGAADGAAADGAADGGAADGGASDGGASDGGASDGGAADGGAGDGAADGASDGGAADGGGDGATGHPFAGAQPVSGQVDLVFIELEAFDGCVIGDGDVIVDAVGGVSFSLECRGFALVPGGSVLITGTGAFDTETTAVGTFSAEEWAIDVPFTMTFSSAAPPADISLQEQVSGYYVAGRVTYSGWFILGDVE